MSRITKGVHLHLLPTSKFKTLLIQFRFKALITTDNITKRSLLASMMDINSKHYPNQSEFRKKLSELYGANFYTDVSRYGQYHVVTLNMECVDEKIVSETGLFSDVMAFLHQVIFHPNANNGQFHEATFKREIEKLRDDYALRYDDKMTYAEDKLDKLYFETREQQMTSYGHEDDLDEITPVALYDSYVKMINEDQLDIFVMGNTTETETLEKLKSFSFDPRSDLKESPFLINDDKNYFKEDNERQEINQTIITMGFQTPVYFHKQSYYAGIVFNGLFGSMPHAKLFQTIREENNLAYSISSELDAYRGMLLVYAGVERKEVERVYGLIINQLKKMCEGDFTEKELEQTKQILKNEIIQLEDTPYSMIEKTYNFSLIGQNELTLEQWIDKINQVSSKEVIELAQQISHRATFILIGENDE